MSYRRSAEDSAQNVVDVATVFPFEAGETPLIHGYADSTSLQELQCTALGRHVLAP